MTRPKPCPPAPGPLEGLAALDEHQVRSWTSWHRWPILALLACAFLSVQAATQPGEDHDDQLIPLTRNEIRRLLTGLRQQLPALQVPAGLVTMATPAPGHRPRLPLPPASPHGRMIANGSGQR
jgi:hypothetical protein